MTQAARTLLELDPADGTVRGDPVPVADLVSSPVLIVLGDPGAGKTHLLTSLAGRGEYVRAKRAIGALPPGPRVVIDALDEVAGDSADALDALLNGLAAAGKPQLVLSCRAQDWYGSAALKDLREMYGADAVKVALLQPLNKAGARVVLEGLVPDPDAFLREADDHGLGDLLRNPNDLKLLVAATRSGWPTGRADLFVRATEVVLTEDNETHQRRADVRVEDLAPAAGWASAAILLSGADELAADGHELADPAQGDLQRAHLRLALRSRAFVAVAAGRVEPAHRTVAEFLGGRWLASGATTAQMEARIRALFTASDGAPPSSLRGLYAWTVNFLPSHFATRWLAADPLGLLHYGDAAILLPSLRAQLLEALVARAGVDPDLGGQGSEREAWAALVIPETAGRIAELLRAPDTPGILMLRLLDAAAATPAPEPLPGVLLQLAEDAGLPAHLRTRAVEAYLASGAPEGPIKALFTRLNTTARTEDVECQIRAAILRRAPTLTPQMVAEVHAALQNPGRDQIAIGRLYLAFERLAAPDLEVLLDLLITQHRAAPPAAGRMGRSERDRILIRTLERLLDERPAAFTDARLVELHRLMITSSALGWRGDKGERLRKLGAAADTAAFALFQSDVLPGAPDDLWPRLVDAFDMDGLLQADNGLWRAVTTLIRDATDPALAAGLMACVIHGAMNRPYPEDLFAELYELVTTRDHLKVHHDALVLRIEPEWKERQRAEAARRDTEREAYFSQLRTRFRDNPQGVSDWTDIRGLNWLGQVFAGLFDSDLGEIEETGMARLAAALGSDLADIVAANIRAGIVKATANRSEHVLALLMGMDLLHAQDPVAIEDPVIISDALAGALYMARLEYGGEGVDPHTGAELGGQAWHERLLQTREGVVEATLIPEIVRGLRRRRKGAPEHVPGLYQLVHDESFAKVRNDWVLKICQQAPDLVGGNADELFLVLFDHPDRAAVDAAIAAALSQPKLRVEARLRWTAAAWLRDPTTHQSALDTLIAKARPAQLGALFNTLSGARRRRAWDALSDAQLADLVSWAARKCRYARSPRGVVHGSDHPWEATRTVESQIAELGVRGTPLAQERLQVLSHDPDIADYGDQLRRAALVAASGARDGSFARRDLRAISGALLDGPPASLAEAVAIVAAELRDLGDFYRNGAGSNWRKFWNMTPDSRSTKTTRAKGENECRNYLLTDLSQRLARFDMRAEALTANEDRIDIAVYHGAGMFPIEVKLEDNAELWTAASGQLSARYVNDYRADGLGIYLVLWTGGGRGKGVKPPDGAPAATSAAELQAMLETRLSGEDKQRVTVLVLDLSEPPPNP